jgi:hypothetical protein
VAATALRLLGRDELASRIERGSGETAGEEAEGDEGHS